VDVGAMASTSSMALLTGGGNSSKNVTDIYITLKEDKELSNEKIVEEITELTKDLKGEINVSSSMMDMGMLAGDGLTVQIKGRELEKLQKIAADVKEIVSKVEGTAEAATGAEDTENEFRITVNKEKAAKYGMTVAQIYQLVNEQMKNETKDATISTDIKDYDVYLETVEQSEASIESLKKLTFTYKDKESGRSFPSGGF